MSLHAVIINDKTEHCSSRTNNEVLVYKLNRREPNPAISTTVIGGCIQELITEFPTIQEKLKIPNPVRFIWNHIDHICLHLQNCSPIRAHRSGILFNVVNEISSTTLISKSINACSLARYLFPNRNQSGKTFIQNQTIESPLKVGFPIKPPEYMMDLWCGSSLYLKIYLDEQDHQNDIKERDLPYSIATEKEDSKNRRRADLQEIELMKVNIMRKSKLLSRQLFLFLPKKKLKWMMLDELSKNILKSEYHLDYMPEVSMWTSVAMHFPRLYEIQIKPTQSEHLPIILHLILGTNKLFRESRTTITDYLRQENCICIKPPEDNYTEIKKTHFLGVLLLKNLSMMVIPLLFGDLSFTRFSRVPFKAAMHLNSNGGRRQLKQRNVVTHNGKCRRNEGNSRTSLFQEGAPDVAQNIAHEPIFCYSGQVHIGGPLNAYWALGESLGRDTSVRKSPWDHQYL